MHMAAMQGCDGDVNFAVIVIIFFREDCLLSQRDFISSWSSAIGS